jgi:hypothetical protein
VQASNKVQPRDDTLPDFDRPGLETVISVIRRVLRLLGYSLDPPGNETIVRRKKFIVNVKDLIAAGALTAGDVLVFTDSEFDARATVLSDGSIELNRTVYDSLSAAAMTVRGRPTNGWADWSVVRGLGTMTLKQLRETVSVRDARPEDQPGNARGN